LSDSDVEIVAAKDKGSSEKGEARSGHKAEASGGEGQGNVGMWGRATRQIFGNPFKRGAENESETVLPTAVKS
jgi:hypothetical protein